MNKIVRTEAVEAETSMEEAEADKIFRTEAAEAEAETNI